MLFFCQPFSAVSARIAASLNVVFGIAQASAAARRNSCPLRCVCRKFLKLSGKALYGAPNRTPLAFAAAMPSACRWRMFSRSVWAT